MQKFLNVKEVADKFEVTPRAVRFWITEGKFPNAFKVGTGTASYLIPLDDVLAFQETREPRPKSGKQ